MCKIFSQTSIQLSIGTKSIEVIKPKHTEESVKMDAICVQKNQIGKQNKRKRVTLINKKSIIILNRIFFFSPPNLHIQQRQRINKGRHSRSHGGMINSQKPKGYKTQ